VSEYCHQMKGMTDSLRGLGEPVADRTLVLNLLHGLNPYYDHLMALIKRIVPFPTFHAVLNELLLEDLTMETETPAPVPTLYSAPPSAQAPSKGYWQGGLGSRHIGGWHSGRWRRVGWRKLEVEGSDAKGRASGQTTWGHVDEVEASSNRALAS
jgi:hypothetical protein